MTDFLAGHNLNIMMILLCPMVGGVLVTLLKSKRRIEIITVVVTGLILIQSFSLVGNVLDSKHIEAFDGIFYVDSLGVLLLVLISGVVFMAALYSINYMGRQYQNGILDDRHLLRYYQAFNMFALTMILVPLANNMGLLWVAVEATTLVSVLLIMLYVKETAIEASWKYLIVATVGLSLALFGIVLYYYANVVSDPIGSNDDKMNWTVMMKNAKLLDPDIVKIGFIFILIGLGTKAGLAPMHTWLPDAHSEAPTPISALLSGVLLNCAIYGIIRFYLIGHLVLGDGFLNTLLMIIGIISVGIAAASIYFQKDLKRMLAFSSIEHMGLVSLAIGFGGLFGIYGAILHIVNHAITKPLMFFASGTISQKYETKTISEIKGVIKTMPLTSLFVLIGTLSIVGLPPFNIFMSEFFILSSGFSSSQYLAIFLVISFLLVIFASFMKHSLGMIFGSPKKQISRGDLGILSIVPMAILAALTIILGFYVPEPLRQLTGNIVQMFGDKIINV